MEQLERKLANQKLLDEEEQTQKGLAKGGGDSATKVTRAQIQESRVKCTHNVQFTLGLLLTATHVNVMGSIGVWACVCN